jgi:hypothetical protein
MALATKIATPMSRDRYGTGTNAHAFRCNSSVQDWREGSTMAEVRGPWWRNTWWGKRTAAMNLSIVVIVLLILLWKTLFM